MYKEQERVEDNRSNDWKNSITARTLSTVKQNFVRDKTLYFVVLAYWVVGYIYLTVTDRAAQSNFLIYFEFLFPLIGVLIPTLCIVYSALKIALKVRKRRILAFKLFMSPENLANMISTILLMCLVCILIGMFTSVKTSFSALQGFQHDVWQANLDKILFLGNDPWQVIFKPFHSETLQSIIETNYNVIWHLQTYIILFFVCLSKNYQNFRKRYFVCFAVSWMIIGNLFAGLFISAGPAFYENVTGDALRFGEQMKMLAAYNESTAIHFQAYLWNLYETRSTAFGSGISAFPSMHVAVVALNAIFAFEINKKLGILATFYALFVGYSSVYLAWHYAIDGIFSAIILIMIYYFTKYLWPSKP